MSRGRPMGESADNLAAQFPCDKGLERTFGSEST